MDNHNTLPEPSGTGLDMDQMIGIAKEAGVSVVKKYGISKSLTVAGAAVACLGVVGLLLAGDSSSDSNGTNKSDETY
jgi:hypothetical protein